MQPYSEENKSMFYFLLILGVACALGFQGWRTLLNNFAVQVAGVSGQQMGVIQGLREVPGFLAFVVIYILFVIKERHLAAGSLLLMGAGIAATGFFPNYVGLIITTMIMSFGFHYYETVNQSLTVQHFSPAQVPLVMGKIRAAMAVSNIVASGLMLLLAFVLDFLGMFLVLGVVVALAAAAALWKNPAGKEAKPQRKGMVLRKRYWLFYALTFIAGARRQVFVAFGVFLLVERFGFSLQEIAGLFLVNNVVNYFVSPQVGKAINRFGERKVLSVEYAFLVVVFLVYAFTSSKALVAAAYVADHILFNGAIAIPSYFRKIADPKEVAPSMAVGFTINHIVAVAVPVLGGLVWMVDYRIPFLGAAGFAVVSLVLAQFVRTPQEES